MFEKCKSTIKIHQDKKLFIRGWIALIIWGISYGIYEYFILYEQVFGVIVPESFKGPINWSMLIFGCLGICYSFGRFSLDELIMLVMFSITIIEDVTFWMCDWIYTGDYPYPCGTWFNTGVPALAVLGNLGDPIGIWPFVPKFYVLSLLALIVFLVLYFKKPYLFKVYLWIIDPFLIAMFASTLISESDPEIRNHIAGLLLLIITGFSYLAIILKTIIKCKRNK